MHEKKREIRDINVQLHMSYHDCLHSVSLNFFSPLLHPVCCYFDSLRVSRIVNKVVHVVDCDE